MRRRWLLGTALAIAVLLNLLGGQPNNAPALALATGKPAPARGAPAQPVFGAASGAAQETPPSVVPRDRLYPQRSAQSTGADLFGKRDWAPPVVAPPTPKPVVVDELPPFPFTYAGYALIGDSREVYLIRDNLSYLVRRGDTLDGSYRIDDITTTDMAVVHLPSERRQVIRIGVAE